jgi:hypothetical protein
VDMMIGGGIGRDCVDGLWCASDHRRETQGFAAGSCTKRDRDTRCAYSSLKVGVKMYIVALWNETVEKISHLVA